VDLLPIHVDLPSIQQDSLLIQQDLSSIHQDLDVILLIPVFRIEAGALFCHFSVICLAHIVTFIPHLSTNQFLGNAHFHFWALRIFYG
jgi:hypothetical protein